MSEAAIATSLWQLIFSRFYIDTLSGVRIYRASARPCENCALVDKCVALALHSSTSGNIESNGYALRSSAESSQEYSLRGSKNATALPSFRTAFHFQNCFHCFTPGPRFEQHATMPRLHAARAGAGDAGVQRRSRARGRTHWPLARRPAPVVHVRSADPASADACVPRALVRRQVGWRRLYKLHTAGVRWLTRSQPTPPETRPTDRP